MLYQATSFKHLPDNRILDQSTLKAFAGDNFNVLLIIYVLARKENVVEKGENGSSIFQQCFLKPSFFFNPFPNNKF